MSYNQTWADKNREKIRKSSKAYYIKNKEKLGQRQKDRKLTPSGRIKYMVTSAICRTKKYGLPYDELFLRDLAKFPPKTCKCCKEELDYDSLDKGLKIPSIDRVDNTKSYIRGNVEIICWQCNRYKSDATIDRLISLAKYAEENAKAL